MGYYMGDFYSGARRTRGDPGFFSFLGKVAKGIGGMIPGVGPIISGVGGAIEKIGARKAPAMLTAGVKAVSGAIVKHPGITAGATAAIGAGAGAALAHMGRTGKMVHGRRRRMNPCNGRALRRAIRRAHAFERLAKKVIGFSSPRKPKGHMYFKRKRKK